MHQSRMITCIIIAGGIMLTAAPYFAAAAPPMLTAEVGPESPQRGCSCSTTVDTYPYDEDFEEGTGLWENVQGDDFDWDRLQGPTPTDNTGPDVDHTLGTEDGYYMYTEASGGNHPDKTAIFLGPCFDLSSLSEPEMAFWYHMAGDSMGSLYLEISGDDCVTWDIQFERHEHQGYDWHLAVIDLSQYTGGTIAVRFRGVTSYGSESDMAIDDIYVGEAVAYPGGCCDLDTGDCLGLMTELDCEAHGNTRWYRVEDCSEDNFCPQPPPANDLCENAVEINALPFFDPAVDFRWATPDLPVSCDNDDCDESGYGVWYRFTPGERCGARIIVEAIDGWVSPFIVAFTGPDCAELTEFYCMSDSQAVFDMEGGATYWILIGNYDCNNQPDPSINISFDCALGACCLGETCVLETESGCAALGGYYLGDGTICTPDLCLYGACCTSNGCEMLTADDCAAAAGDFKGSGVPCELDTCPPPNETCLTALPIGNGNPAVVADCSLASLDDDAEASCQEWSDRDLWYVYTATCTGAVLVDTEGSEVWDTILSVWDECGGTEIACNDNNDFNNLAALEFDSVAGETYYIRFATLFGFGGVYQINISCTEAPQGACCFGDDCYVEYQRFCESAGGVYAGDDTVCSGEDCNGNGVQDVCDIAFGVSPDCNGNGVPDECDVAAGTSLDRDGNGVPDECDPDCNENGIIDGCDLSCDGGCAEIPGCGQSTDCQGDGIPDECQLVDEGCTGVQYDSGYADLVNGLRPDSGWANLGVADDFIIEDDIEGDCLRFDIYDFVDSGNLPVMRVRIYENPSGLMNLGSFSAASPIYDRTFSLEDGNLEIEDTGEDLYQYDLLRFTATGADYSLNSGDYAIHLTFPDTVDAGFWATAGTDNSSCAIIWGEWADTPQDACAGGENLTRLSFAFLGQQDNDCNHNLVPDECDIAIEYGGFCDPGFGPCDTDHNRNGIPDECERLCFGDLDGNRVVNIADLATLLGHYGETGDVGYYDGDLDGDQDVDISDLAALLGVYGTVCD